MMFQQGLDSGIVKASRNDLHLQLRCRPNASASPAELHDSRERRLVHAVLGASDSTNVR
jgi:hypothetical protein